MRDILLSLLFLKYDKKLTAFGGGIQKDRMAFIKT